jgi:L-asparaginase II
MGLCRAAAQLARAALGQSEFRVAQAMRCHPEWVGGTGRHVTALMRAVPGLVAKDGAEAVFVAALADGSAAAVKVADGGDRARVPVLVALLHRLGVDADGLEELAEHPVHGGGGVVGAVRAVL